jgi:hypothetical protein
MSEQPPPISISSLALRNLSQTCKSPSTREVYVKVLNYFIDYLKLQTNDYGKLLELDTKTIQMHICDFITFLWQSNCSYATVSLYVAAIRKFYDMNDLSLNWRKVRQFMGEHEKIVEDRPYTHSEIATLLQGPSVISNSYKYREGESCKSHMYWHLQ